MGHQGTGVDLLQKNLEAFLLACEQGTGKTWMLLSDAEKQIIAGYAEALLVVAPKGVHTNWVLREIPEHVSIPVRAAYFSSGASRKIKNEVEKLFRPREPGQLIVLTINIDSINFQEGYALAARFLKHYECIMVIDESSRIKSPPNKSKRTGQAIKLGALAKSRRCASGTPITNSPADIYPQFEFLAPGQGLLGTRSYRAFVAEYTELLPQNSYMMKHIAKNLNPKLVKTVTVSCERKLKILEEKEQAAMDEFGDPVEITAEEKEKRHKKRLDEMVLEELAPYLPQIPKKDAFDLPVYKNLDKLNAILKPYMYRVLKKDCLNLPPKIFTTHFHELTPHQRAVYEQVRDELRLEIGEEIDIYSPLTIQTKLQQIASGFILREGVVTKISDIPGEEDETDAQLMPMSENPRIDLLRETIEDINGKFIIWARFRQEIVQIAELLAEMKVSCVEYHGGVKQKFRDPAIDEFQKGAARCFLGNAKSGGIGLTLTKAQTAIYYSQDFNLETRLQSEDRNHRIGTNDNVLYIDFAAVDTLDIKISKALQNKAKMATNILDR